MGLALLQTGIMSPYRGSGSVFPQILSPKALAQNNVFGKPRMAPIVVLFSIFVLPNIEVAVLHRIWRRGLKGSQPIPAPPPAFCQFSQSAYLHTQFFTHLTLSALLGKIEK